MSSHSRSSSEIEAIQYSEILPVFIGAFSKDFTFGDVKNRVKELFTDHEYASILEEPDEKRKLFRLFWILYSKESIIQKFLDVISYDYKWLADMVIIERNTMPSKQTELYLEAVKMLRSGNQKHTDYNVHRMEPFMKLRQALKSMTPQKNFVVQLGDLGTGKKWLAIDVCSEYTVLKAMDFKIYWIDVSQCKSPEEDLRVLQEFRLLLGDTYSSASPTNNGSAMHQRLNIEFFDIANRKLESQQNLRKKLQQNEYKNCLLVLLNVPNVKTWKNFNLGCKTLIITRNKKVSESLSKKIAQHLTIEASIELSEFYVLFEKYLEMNRDQFPSNAADIYIHSNGHPYLLSTIAQSLRQKKYDWNEWIRNLQNLRISDNKFTEIIKISLNVLTPELLELYATFAIFPHSISIPANLLATLWNKPLRDALDIIHTFHTYSIVKEDIQPDGTIACTLPFIYSSHLKENSRIHGMINSAELHRKVIDYYNIEEAFHNRTEVELCTSQHDAYFFYCIGYHILQAKCYDLFSQLYFDYGFLEQKIRAVGLLHTICDLKYYEEQIIMCDPRRQNLLYDICEFLPKVEEKLVHSKDTCLLQYALMASGTVYEEACEQVKQFCNKIWFTEKGNFHRRRQIVNLPHSAKIVHFLEQDLCLIVLDNNNMLLADISLDYNNDTIYLVNDENKRASIIEAHLFRIYTKETRFRPTQHDRSDAYILTLDKGGELKLWSIADDRRRSLMNRRSSKQKVNPINFSPSAEIQTKKCKQSIREGTIGKRGKIVAFHIEQPPPRYGGQTFLHVVFDTGDVCVYEWNIERREFHSTYIPILPTHLKDIRFLCKILEKYYMMLNTAGNISFWNLRDSSNVPFSFQWPAHKTGLICYEVYTMEETTEMMNAASFVHDHHTQQRQYTCIIFIFGDKVLRLTFEQQKFSLLMGELETLYEMSDAHNIIKCAKLSQDGHYLVLGTKYGLIVIDTHSKSEILRSNVSKAISCVDIYELDDRVFKYVIICGLEHKKDLNIFALRKTGEDSIGWSHNVSTISNEESNDPQLEPDVWLLGEKLYDIAYFDEGILVVAADSKNRIHQVCTTNTKNWSIVMPTETSHRITAITTNKHNSFAGYENGAIFNINEEIFESSLTNMPISYLQLIDDQILVASVKIATRTRVRNFQDNIEMTYEFDAHKCFKLFDHYLLLVNDFGLVLILDINRKFKEVYVLNDVLQHEVGSYTLGGCDLKNSLLFLATSTFKVHIYNFTQEGECLRRTFRIANKNDIVEGRVTCLTASDDASLVAVGLQNGEIEVYKVTEGTYTLSFLYRLQSHSAEIYDMSFSPNTDVLISCSEQLCFWSVAHMLNNPLTVQTTKRRSSRFSSQRSSDIEEVDATKISAGANGHHLQVMRNDLMNEIMTKITFKHTNGDGDGDNVIIINPWHGKHGPAVKPELLACIKFDGNKAQRIFANQNFTQFNTIDDEGVYYHLTLLNVGRKMDIIYTNGDNHIDDDVVDINYSTKYLTINNYCDVDGIDI